MRRRRTFRSRRFFKEKILSRSNGLDRGIATRHYSFFWRKKWNFWFLKKKKKIGCASESGSALGVSLHVRFCVLVRFFELLLLRFIVDLKVRTGKPFGKGRISTVDLLVLTSLDKWLCLLIILSLTLLQNNEEVNCRRAASVPWYGHKINRPQGPYSQHIKTQMGPIS
jgi:hypothetical protein